jgi:hypothetical protein
MMQIRERNFKNIWNASECRMSILWESSNFTCCHLSPNYFKNAMPGGMPRTRWLCINGV